MSPQAFILTALAIICFGFVLVWLFPVGDRRVKRFDDVDARLKSKMQQYATENDCSVYDLLINKDGQIFEIR